MLRCTNLILTLQVVDPDQKHFRSLITFCGVTEPDIKPSHATVPLMLFLVFLSLFMIIFAQGTASRRALVTRWPAWT